VPKVTRVCYAHGRRKRLGFATGRVYLLFVCWLTLGQCVCVFPGLSEVRAGALCCGAGWVCLLPGLERLRNGRWEGEGLPLILRSFGAIVRDRDACDAT
jgi:hypothetical protein